jgi:hypothetical protein
MRKGILSLTLPGQRKRKPKNIELAEQAANVQKQPEPPKEENFPMEEPFVQKINVPKSRALLKSVTKKHDEMVKRAKR